MWDVETGECRCAGSAQASCATLRTEGDVRLEGEDGKGRFERTHEAVRVQKALGGIATARDSAATPPDSGGARCVQLKEYLVRADTSPVALAWLAIDPAGQGLKLASAADRPAKTMMS